MIVKSKIKYINSLGDKKLRDTERVFVAEGPKIINELLDEPSLQPQEIFALKGWIDQHRDSSWPVTEIDNVMLERLSFLSTPNQVIGIFKMPDNGQLQLKNKISIVADGIQDPGNLGTIIRCADWFGVKQVICSRDSADIYNPKTVQSTMGSIARVKVFYEDLPYLLNNIEMPVYVGALNGKDVTKMNRITEGVIIIGNESKGVSEELLKIAHQKITISKKGEAESLNAAVATGIILSHLLK
ncbi:MAG TPA: RNA methyltransferase [Flavitalea sp.]|nr:RNA methyltransferase [Flavitalea sp.]